MNKTIVNIFWASLISLMISLCFSINLMLSWFILCLFCVFIFVFFFLRKSDRSIAILLLVFLYPILPFHAGIDLLPRLLPVFTLHRVILALMFLLWISGRNNLTQSISSFPLNRLFAFLFVVIFISGLFSTAKSATFFYLGTFVLEFYFFSVMFFDLASDERFINRIIKFVVISAFVAAMIGIIEFITRFNIYSWVRPYREGLEYAITTQIREGDVRIRGAFDHAISFGVFLAFGAVSAIYLYSITKHAFKRIFYVMIFLILFLAVFLTLSRTSILALLVSVAIYLIIKKGKKELVICSSLFIFSLIQPFFFNVYREKLFLLVKGSVLPFSVTYKHFAGSVFSRLEMIQAMMKLIWEKPFLGHGKIYFGNYFIDNYYIGFALSFGLIGLIGLVVLVCKIFYMAVHVSVGSLSRDNKLFSQMMLSVLIGLLLVWLTLALTSYFYLIWIYVGILCRLYISNRKTFVKK